jgi:hypothetical protein
MPRFTAEELKALGDACFDDCFTITRRFKNRMKSLWLYEGLEAGLIPVWGKVVRRYQPDLSNSKFKHRYVKRDNGDIRLLKTLPRSKCQPLIGMRDACRAWKVLPTGAQQACGTGVWDLFKKTREKTNRRVRRAKPGINGPGQSTTNPVVERAPPSKARTFLSNPSIRPVARVSNGILDVVGGPAVPFAPNKAHWKYWYFRRKRGVWTPSQHHPYKDEAKIYGYLEYSVD